MYVLATDNAPHSQDNQRQYSKIKASTRHFSLNLMYMLLTKSERGFESRERIHNEDGHPALSAGTSLHYPLTRKAHPTWPWESRHVTEQSQGIASMMYSYRPVSGRTPNALLFIRSELPKRPKRCTQSACHLLPKFKANSRAHFPFQREKAEFRKRPRFRGVTGPNSPSVLARVLSRSIRLKKGGLFQPCP